MTKLIFILLAALLMPNISFSEEVGRSAGWFVTHESDNTYGHKLIFYNSKTNEKAFEWNGDSPLEIYLETKVVIIKGHTLAVTKWGGRNGEALVIFEPSKSKVPFEPIWSMVSISYTVGLDSLNINYNHEVSESDPTVKNDNKVWRPKAMREPKSVSKPAAKSKVIK